MKLSLLEKDQLSKDICVGPVTPEQVVISDESCADCGASNAHRVLN